ncbi:hypothetical protein LMG28727_07051 [Paraburkholderia kirstenboschensis]|uniref:hypothetical protein n=1 Tax=Paraburkholderia kirstenboschensis TaxID=1245436 RepID=UPI000B22BACF|nr:hypothetical protein [Paraburkholderia kirstenboschensis]CAD6560150.1 hypothetical protein LMG28727_07051 [Paraburkholderia kirstenboschensis]
MKLIRQVFLALGILSTPFAHADPVRLEFVVNLKTGERGMPNQYDKLELGEGSGRYVASLRQSGKVTSKGLLEDATVLDWGLHEVPTEEVAADGSNEAEPNGGGPGYLVFTLPSGDKLTMRLHMHLQYVPESHEAPRPFIFGLWQIVGASGSLSHLQGTGVIRVERRSAEERLWILEGEVGRAKTASQ